ncbi:MAG: hypothetical protein IJO04_01575 [Oscillospiraceae bacterium]|nr:hypothetical protein [Oscillospiraceae bacterium]
MSGAKKRRKIIALCTCIALLCCFLLFLVTCVSFRQTHIPGDAGECISLAFFEKQKMRTVNKVVLTGPKDKVVTITDMGLIDEIVKETMVATHANLGCLKGGNLRIDLFNGDQLVRSMTCADCCEYHIHVYNADSTHWILFPGYSRSPSKTANEGWVILSKELKHKLDALLEEA